MRKVEGEIRMGARSTRTLMRSDEDERGTSATRGAV